MIELECLCRTRLKVPDTFVGKAGKCAKCKQIMRLIGQPGASGSDLTGAPSPIFDSRLTITAGPHRAGEQLLLSGKKPLSIGKLPTCSVVLEGAMVSRHHCTLTRTDLGSNWVVEDNNSTNGIFANRQRAHHYALQDGDVLTVGEYELTYSTISVASAMKPAMAGAPSSNWTSPSTAPRQRHFGDGISTGLAGDPPPDDADFAVVEESPEPSDMYNVIEEPTRRLPPAPAPGAPALGMGSAIDLPGFACTHVPGAPVCPSCNRSLPMGSRICIGCGIDIRTGKALITKQGVDEDSLFVAGENASRLLSWIIPIGLFPISSDAYGHQKPYAIWAITVITVIASVLFWALGGLSRNATPQAQTLMLWSGTPTNTEINLRYNAQGPIVSVVDSLIGVHQAGDRDAGGEDDSPDDFSAPAARHSSTPELDLIHRARDGAVTLPRAQAEQDSTPEAVAYANKKEELKGTVPDAELPSAAYNALPASDQIFGHFRWYQTITYALLHGGIMHLAGNMVFLLVFGGRVNALLGQVKTVILYGVLAVISGLSHYLAMMSNHPPTPMLGASGAIMGLAGMYLVLFPINKVYMIFWIRLGLFTGFRRFMKIWAPRGFWVLLFFIAFDVYATAMGSHDGTAHWAHVGGFVAGMVVALLLLMTRMVNAGGGDILSVLLGRRAWAFIGKPTDRIGAAVSAVPSVRAIDISYR